MTKRRRHVVIPALLVGGALGYFGWAVLGDDDTADPAPVEVTADGRRYDDVASLAAASDLVVEGTVVRVDEGRTITDPDEPDVGIRTQLVQLDVAGDPAGVTVEQEAALLDGTPITVNGLPALAPGDHGVAFLVRGRSEQFPYTALVNEQAWFPVVDGVLAPTEASGPLGEVWQDRLPDELLDEALGT